jgi:hypothetical protein
MEMSKSESFRIATWNLERPKLNGWKKNPLIQEKMSEIDADIWILTETNASIAPASKSEPLAGYVSLASLPATSHSLGESFSTIWSRFGIKRSIKTFDIETAVCAEIDTPLGLMLVYGTILTYKDDKGLDGKSKPWVEHDKEIGRHGNDWCQIQAMFPHIPLIVAGDFNQTRDGSKRYCSPNGIALLDEQLRRNNLTSLTDEDFGDKGMLTVSPWSKTGEYRHNVDHICITKGHFNVQEVGAWDHFVGSQKLSDHNGVYVDLALGSKETE